MMKNLAYLAVLLMVCSCVTEDSEPLIFDTTNRLSLDIEGRIYQPDAVIACAASDSLDSDLIRIYYYPEEGATNVKFYETGNISANPNDYNSYTLLDIEDTPFFGGTLRQFERPVSVEEYIIITYEVDDKIKISTPIRTKNNIGPTDWVNTITINQEQSSMPKFNWDIASEEDNVIFFQVVSNSEGQLLSGTYTEQNQFQYYNLSNVVLNITQGTPPELIVGQDYTITVMDVSIDNWVNEVISSTFTAE
ncbi:MAG: hypothetical protein AAF901_05980 [Bacteroidota bacterium]